jgi:gas vesicle protein
MANVRSESEKSSDWSRSSKGNPGGSAGSSKGATARSGPANDRESQQSGSQSQSGSYGQEQNPRNVASNFTATTLRSLGQFYDMQAATARAMLRSQMRTASAFGLPDYSRIFEIGDDRALHLYSSATENLVSFVKQADNPLAEIPSQICRLLEQQAIDVTERWKDGLEELQQQASESMQELKEFSRQQVEELARASESISNATHTSLREGGEQFRAAVSQGREMAGRQSEAMRKESERTAGDVEDAAQEGAETAEEGVEQAAEQAPRSSRHSRAA